MASKYSIGDVVIWLGGRCEEDVAKVVVIAGVLSHEDGSSSYTYRTPDKSVPENIWHSEPEDMFLTPEEWRSWKLASLRQLKEHINREADTLAARQDEVWGCLHPLVTLIRNPEVQDGRQGAWIEVRQIGKQRGQCTATGATVDEVMANLHKVFPHNLRIRIGTTEDLLDSHFLDMKKWTIRKATAYEMLRKKARTWVALRPYATSWIYTDNDMARLRDIVLAGEPDAQFKEEPDVR